VTTSSPLFVRDCALSPSHKSMKIFMSYRCNSGKTGSRLSRHLSFVFASLALLFGSVGILAQTPAVTNQPTVIEMPVGRRQLFLDDFAVASVDKLARVLHQPVKRGAVIKPDVSWETCLQTRCAPAWDPGQKLFKLWMITSTTFPEVGGTTYATSKDGIHWTKPVLGQYEINGSKKNNFVTVDPKLGWPANAIENVVYDPDDPDASRRYKGLGHCYGREPLVSPDGLKWRRLDVPQIPSADESNLNYDPQTRAFIATVKTTPGGRRAVNLSTSKDFEHWSAPVLVFSADAEDQALARKVIGERLADSTLSHPTYNNPAEYAADVYNMPIFRYEGFYIGLPAIFYRTAHRESDGFHHVQLICSRDLRDWRRLGNRQPFIGPSPVDSGAYDLTQILPPTCPIRHGNELWFYYTGIKYRCGAPAGSRDQGAVCLAVLRRDGFISLDAGDEPGSITTLPFKLPSVKLRLNVNASCGFVQAALLEAGGQLRCKARPISGDQLQGKVTWTSRPPPAGSEIRLRLNARNASLFSYWFE
jgi:hypothetical protein